MKAEPSTSGKGPLVLIMTAMVGVVALVVLAVVLAPEGRLACSTERMLTETSPDGRWALTLCRRPMWFAMPGGSGDAPGWIVLRDREGAIRVCRTSPWCKCTATQAARPSGWEPA